MKINIEKLKRNQYKFNVSDDKETVGYSFPEKMTSSEAEWFKKGFEYANELGNLRGNS